ncbi:hypothetical protein OESDEN_06457 [Oesophagostomum dentatum]|uniref:Uncharacterized protein n=1 Tax=Oesophagostomum dentatum TaxID=61180 RepID=A0A0B1T7Z0_OESDE|nr:hypothetical protein OESDEN_06457 [Oesophagostomum dentatum]
MRGALTVWQKSIGVFGDCLPQYALFQKPIIIMTCINHRRDPEWRNIYQRLHGYQNIMSIPVL